MQVIACVDSGNKVMLKTLFGDTISMSVKPDYWANAPRRHKNAMQMRSNYRGAGFKETAQREHAAAESVPVVRE